MGQFGLVSSVTTLRFIGGLPSLRKYLLRRKKRQVDSKGYNYYLVRNEIIFLFKRALLRS